MADQYGHTSMEEDDIDGLMYNDDDEPELSEIDDRWCLVGRFLTKRSIDFQAMQHKMATLWQPGRGMYVKELGPNYFIFQFYHEVDIERIMDGSPWTFDRIPLVFERVKPGVEIGSPVQGKSKDKAVLVDNDESQTNLVLLLVDTKRRRTDIEPNASNGPLSEKSDGPTILHNENGSMLEDENVERNKNGPEAMEDESTMGSYGVYFSKNLVGAGSVQQARHSS
uniref:DUF4283 domain-containing protein n=1 Tax=Cannabis sativa TaxID=3483 RepID=A0A803PRU2_CANSA